MSDLTNPAHYTRFSIEPIDAIEAWELGFRLANVVKYVARADHKGQRLRDLQKARWYLDREIAHAVNAEDPQWCQNSTHNDACRGGCGPA